MVKERGFYASRRREPRRPLLRWFWLAVLLGLLWTVGVMRAWSQNSGLLSNSSSDDLKKWSELSMKFNQGLDEQSTRLRQALTEMETSKASSQKSTLLLEQSLTANESLKIYNTQIASRMQERDEDLAWAYERIEKLEKQRLRMIVFFTVISAVLTAVIVGMVALKFKFK